MKKYPNIVAYSEKNCRNNSDSKLGTANLLALSGGRKKYATTSMIDPMMIFTISEKYLSIPVFSGVSERA
jgi:hypothetical protein